MLRLKRFIRSAAAAVLTLVLVTGIASAAFGTGVVKEGPLRLRAGASTSSTVLGNAPKGATVEILEDAVDGWYKVSYKGKVGYMSAQYLTVTPYQTQEIAETPVATAETPAAQEEPAAAAEQPAEAEAAEAEAAEATVEYARVDTSALNVRAGAGTEFDKVGMLYGGSIVTVISREGDWTVVEYGSVKGYVATEYLTFGTKEELNTGSAVGRTIIEMAKKYLGTRYVYGGASPSGFDCSGFVYYLYKQAGYSVPRTGSAMWNNYPHVSRENLQPGDVVCFTRTSSSKSYITHVGLYVGDNIFIHSSSPSSGGVIYTSLSEKYYATRYAGAVRLL